MKRNSKILLGVGLSVLLLTIIIVVVIASKPSAPASPTAPTGRPCFRDLVIESVAPNVVAIKYNGKYLMAHEGGWTHFRQDIIGPWERFTQDNGCLRTAHGTYLSFTDGKFQQMPHCSNHEKIRLGHGRIYNTETDLELGFVHKDRYPLVAPINPNC